MPVRIPDKFAFQPSADTLHKWLSTRKGDLSEGDLNVGGLTMPRYFSDVGYSKDQFWFIIAILGEIIGLGTTMLGGAKSGGSFFVFATITVVMFIFCDFFFAYKLHRNEDEKCILASRKLLIDDDNASELARLRKILNRGKVGDLFYQLGIILIAIIKVIGIVLLGVFNELMLYLPFAIIYFIVAYIHLQHTGYFFAYMATKNAIEKDYAEFADQRLHQAQENRQRIATAEPLVDHPIKHNPHKIIEDPEKKSGNKYVIIAKGVLTDEDITGLITGQSNDNKIGLFRACRQLQLDNY